MVVGLLFRFVQVSEETKAVLFVSWEIIRGKSKRAKRVNIAMD